MKNKFLDTYYLDNLIKENPGKFPDATGDDLVGKDLRALINSDLRTQKKLSLARNKDEVVKVLEELANKKKFVPKNKKHLFKNIDTEVDIRIELDHKEHKQPEKKKDGSVEYNLFSVIVLIVLSLTLIILVKKIVGKTKGKR